MLFEDYEKANPVHSPVRMQYLQIKQQNPDAILFFRMGDFYEMFDDDAEIVARELEIALTRRDFGRGVHDEFRRNGREVRRHEILAGF